MPRQKLGISAVLRAAYACLRCHTYVRTLCQGCTDWTGLKISPFEMLPHQLVPDVDNNVP
jgi:hypothetical protein